MQRISISSTSTYADPHEKFHGNAESRYRKNNPAYEYPVLEEDPRYPPYNLA